MWIVRFALKRPYTFVIVALLIAIFGVTSIVTTPTDILPDIAEGVADAVSRHAMTLQARTLLFVFGDHGFILDKEGAPHAGGASPEEVLVPAFAFLVGEVH